MTRHAHGGDYLLPNGDLFQWPEWVKHQQTFDPSWQTAENGASQISERFTISGPAAFNIAFAPPEGRALVIWARQLFLPEGTFEIDLLNADFTGGTPTLKSTLDDRRDGDGTVQTNVLSGVTISGEETLRSRIAFDAGNQPGSGKPPGATSLDEVFRIATKSTIVRINKTDAGDALCSLSFVVWEFPA